MTGKSWLASTSGTRPETSTASCSAETKRRVRYSGRRSTYCFRVPTSDLPAFSASQRRSVSSDHTLAMPGCLTLRIIIDPKANRTTLCRQLQDQHRLVETAAENGGDAPTINDDVEFIVERMRQFGFDQVV